MANNFLTSNLVTDRAVAIFKSLTSFHATAYHKYENMFHQHPYKSGDTINVRLDNFYKTQRGDAVTGENIVEESVPLTIAPLFSVPVLYTPSDLDRKIEDFTDEFITPAVRSIVTSMNNYIYNQARTQVANYVGDISAPLSSFADINQINPHMDSLNMNNYMRYLSIDPFNASSVQNSPTIQNSFVSPLNKDVTMNASMGRLADIDIFKDNAVESFVSGTHANGGSITVSTAVSSGNIISFAGLTPGATFLTGDLFELSTVKEFDRIRQLAGRIRKQFTVTADAVADGAGNISLQVYPPLVADGPRQNFITPGATPNVIPVNEVMLPVTEPTNGYVKSLAYTERGCLVAMPPLHPMDAPESYVFTSASDGISMRISKTAEVLANKNVIRVDAQLANRWIPDQATWLLSQDALNA